MSLHLNTFKQSTTHSYNQPISNNKHIDSICSFICRLNLHFNLFFCYLCFVHLLFVFCFLFFFFVGALSLSYGWQHTHGRPLTYGLRQIYIWFMLHLVYVTHLWFMSHTYGLRQIYSTWVILHTLMLHTIWFSIHRYQKSHTWFTSHNMVYDTQYGLWYTIWFTIQHVFVFIQNVFQTAMHIHIFNLYFILFLFCRLVCFVLLFCFLQFFGLLCLYSFVMHSQQTFFYTLKKKTQILDHKIFVILAQFLVLFSFCCCTFFSPYI